ncbi:hypothetical protein HPB47_024342 [Ixodes persulcatus]|uniref:Uncharacterized protein n=1 Tax=Ixodes persulcatus TaxID=34615 RepID=A0AC60Q6J2_IXOPE|nr:hypothetical protein HPB47_024342 [Ixodes persulcatus]
MLQFGLYILTLGLQRVRYFYYIISCSQNSNQSLRPSSYQRSALEILQAGLFQAAAIGESRGCGKMFNPFCRHFYKSLGVILAALLLLEYSFNLSAYNKKNFELLRGRISRMFESSLILDSLIGGVARTGNGTSVGNTSEMAVSSNKSLEFCPLVPPNLVGPIKVLQQAPSLEEIEKNFTHIMPGGRFKPKKCLARHRVAILVSYRNREKQLNVFLHNMHQFLPRQQIDYGIFVIEQDENGKFNRAKLFNVGYLESLALYDYECFIFHDVDLVPEDDRILYTCPEKPRHLSNGSLTLMTCEIPVRFLPHAIEAASRCARMSLPVSETPRLGAEIGPGPKRLAAAFSAQRFAPAAKAGPIR